MKMKEIDRIPLRGSLKVFTKDVGNGVWELQRKQKNLIVTAGKTFVRDLLSGTDTINYLKAFAFGTGTTAPAVGDTDLETAVAYSGANKYKAFENFTNDTVTKVTFVGWFAGTEPVTQPVDLTETGLFTATGASGGTMYCRATFDAITKTSNLELRLEYSLEF